MTTGLRAISLRAPAMRRTRSALEAMPLVIAARSGAIHRISRYVLCPIVGALLGLAGCAVNNTELDVAQGTGPDPELPAPDTALIPTVNIADAAQWADDARPTAAAGLTVHAFARGLAHPRWLYVLPNGDVLVAETNAPERPENATGVRGWVMKKIMARAGATVPSPNKILLLRDTTGDGIADEREVFLSGLNSPFGMALMGDTLYVADTDALLAFPYERGETHIDAAPRTVTELPAGPINHHWTKNVIAGTDGRTLYVTVGSNSNVGENGMAAERERAAIWRVNAATGAHALYATGLRNPNGLAYVPQPSGREQLWTVVNERDEIGGDLVPDYMTAVRENAFYGWPYSYYGAHVDPRVKPQRPDRVAAAIEPDYALGPHTASLGLAYAGHDALGARYAHGLFVGQHGSWNRKPRSGYKVIYVPFSDGVPDGEPIDVLTGFVDRDSNARGRPVGVALDHRGDLLVADDVGNAVWRVSAAGDRVVTARRSRADD